MHLYGTSFVKFEDFVLQENNFAQNGFYIFKNNNLIFKNIIFVKCNSESNF